MCQQAARDPTQCVSVTRNALKYWSYAAISSTELYLQNDIQ
jgi:hypothetical protein